jgi:hypothetical protein
MEVSVAELSIDFVGGDGSYLQSLGDYLDAIGISARRSGNSLFVSASSSDECTRLGVSIADFISSRHESFPLHVDGPGAETTLHQLHTSDDARVISSILAASAFLI